MKSLLILALFCVPAIAKAQCVGYGCMFQPLPQTLRTEKTYAERTHEEYLARTMANEYRFALENAVRQQAFYESQFGPRPQQQRQQRPVWQVPQQPMPQAQPMPGVRPLPGFQNYLNPGNPYSR